MADVVMHPASYPPAPAVMQILARHNREALIAFVEIAIDLLDTQDGNPDAEDATDLEDDFTLSPVTRRHYADRGPGCTVADPGEDSDPGEMDDGV